MQPGHRRARQTAVSTSPPAVEAMVMAQRKPLTVVDAVHDELDAIAKLDADLARSGFAASALALAQALDDPENSATSKSMCARALLDALDRLRELAPEEKKDGKVDEISERRATRRRRAAAAAD
jgi:hypothetical protein